MSPVVSLGSGGDSGCSRGPRPGGGGDVSRLPPGCLVAALSSPALSPALLGSFCCSSLLHSALSRSPLLLPLTHASPPRSVTPDLAAWASSGSLGSLIIPPTLPPTVVFTNKRSRAGKYLYVVYFTLNIWETTRTMYICNHPQKISNVRDASLYLSSLLSA